ncbi:hypothetical protein [Hymenobacter persicinus]|uniref:NADP-dependent oxidoreductase domain-containing protein n=1 Tax=Hymenobacter persicinus TaxID=2025506 RepID=A0A4Q5LIX4_9BACT|nr:hypothetical protein [Hymenobacter persicinus]RYU83257.1 hypothetical protein EWM57_02930 [Hymenobacter persicinus]
MAALVRPGPRPGGLLLSAALAGSHPQLSVLIGASKPNQLTDSLFCLDNLPFSEEELGRIEQNLGAPEVAG